MDMKGGMEFNTFEGLPHLTSPPVSEVEDAEIELGRVVQELERRQGLIKGGHVKSLREWKAKFPGDRLPYVVVVVDEFAEFRALTRRRAPTSAKAVRPSSLVWARSVGSAGRSECT